MGAQLGSDLIYQPKSKFGTIEFCSISSTVGVKNAAKKTERYDKNIFANSMSQWDQSVVLKIQAFSVVFHQVKRTMQEMVQNKGRFVHVFVSCTGLSTQSQGAIEKL